MDAAYSGESGTVSLQAVGYKHERPRKQHTSMDFSSLLTSWASLVAQMVRNPPAMQETWVRLLGWEDPLEKGMATCSSILAYRIPWTEEPGRLIWSVGSQSKTPLSN